MSDATEIEKKIAEIEARRAALADAEAKRLEPTPEERLALAQRGLAEDEALAAAQTQYGARAVRLINTEAGAIIVRRPHIAAFRKFQDSGELKSDQAEELVKASLVYPSKPEFDRLMRDLPGCLTQAASVCVELAGFRSAEVRTK
jgi:hypothetical protein